MAANDRTKQQLFSVTRSDEQTQKKTDSRIASALKVKHSTCAPRIFLHEPRPNTAPTELTREFFYSEFDGVRESENLIGTRQYYRSCIED